MSNRSNNYSEFPVRTQAPYPMLQRTAVNPSVARIPVRVRISTPLDGNYNLPLAARNRPFIGHPVLQRLEVSPHQPINSQRFVSPFQHPMQSPSGIQPSCPVSPYSGYPVIAMPSCPPVLQPYSNNVNMNAPRYAVGPSAKIFTSEIQTQVTKVIQIGETSSQTDTREQSISKSSRSERSSDRGSKHRRHDVKVSSSYRRSDTRESYRRSPSRKSISSSSRYSELDKIGKAREREDTRSLGKYSGSRAERRSRDRTDASYTERKNSFASSRSQRRSKPDDTFATYDLPGPNDDGNKDDSVPRWCRSSPADLYFTKNSLTGLTCGTDRMTTLEDRIHHELCDRSQRCRETMLANDTTSRLTNPQTTDNVECKSGSNSDEDTENNIGVKDDDGEEEEGEDDDDDEKSDEESMLKYQTEAKKRKSHPLRLNDELWYNDKGEVNDGLYCQCSPSAKKIGIQHDIYPGEQRVPLCEMSSNCKDSLFHYRITMSPGTNFMTKHPTVIKHDDHEFVFEGFSIFSHYKIPELPPCRVLRFYIEYTVRIVEEEMPENFTVRSLDLFNDFLYNEILELVDLDWTGPGVEAGCRRFHVMPRFSRSLPDNGRELLSMNEVLMYLLRSARPILTSGQRSRIHDFSSDDWDGIVSGVRGAIVTFPGMKPSSLRVDQLDRQQELWSKSKISDDVSPVIVHFGIRPAQASYAGDPRYQKKFKKLLKVRHLLSSKPKVSSKEKKQLWELRDALQRIKLKSAMKREVSVEVSSDGFLHTGFKSDICQHALVVPTLVSHLRFHHCLYNLEDSLGYHFKDRYLLQLAMTHDSYPVNFGTNPDHVRNSLSNCGCRQVEYGDRASLFMHTRKRGINNLLSIMSKQGQSREKTSKVPHNERLEYLGDSIIEFLSSSHLFYLFPWLEEGGLSTYRAALVQNQNLALLAKKINLDSYVLFAHNNDLYQESSQKHAMANCYEALIGALYLDGGMAHADRVFAMCVFDDIELRELWLSEGTHPLQHDEPHGDRHWITSSPVLQKLVEFEKTIGVEYTHIRLLARSLTLRHVGFNNLTLGHNQRLEFLGDTILQLLSTDYLYRHFPSHHEGHLTLLRSSLVNKKTQSIVFDDLGMINYVIVGKTRSNISNMLMKEKADLLEAFLGSLFVDKGLDYCKCFCSVCFFPRLKEFILFQDWNDAKSHLQQCCLTLRDPGSGSPDIPQYKVIGCVGPTNTRRYTVAVYFRKKRLATGTGHSIHLAQMAAAQNALCQNTELFPIILHQKRFLKGSQQSKRPRITNTRRNY